MVPEEEVLELVGEGLLPKAAPLGIKQLRQKVEGLDGGGIFQSDAMFGDRLKEMAKTQKSVR